MDRPRIFISAVTRELGTARALTARVLNRRGYDTVCEEDFPTGYGELKTWLAEQIDACEGVIQLVGDGYGSEPPPSNDPEHPWPDPRLGLGLERCSYTQFEFLYARHLAKGAPKRTWVILIRPGELRDSPPEELDLPDRDAGPVTAAHPARYQSERRALQQAYVARLISDNHLRHGADSKLKLENLLLKLHDELDVLHDEARRSRQQLIDSQTDLARLLEDVRRVTIGRIRAHLPEAGPPDRPSHTVMFVSGGLAAMLSISVLWLLNLSLHDKGPGVGLLGAILGVVTVVFAILQYRLMKPQPDFARNRRVLLGKMKRLVQQRYDFTLSDKHKFTFQFDRIVNAVARPFSQEFDLELRQPVPENTTVVELFDESDGSLLILGNPGSGKSRVMLELASELVARAEQDADLPVPFFFRLSSWSFGRPGQPALGEWLIDELDKEFRVGRDLASSMIKEDHLVALLDGLDEVQSLADRAACAEAINVFRRQHPLIPVVLACRMTEYADLPRKLLLETAIEVRPLSHEQIDKYLTHCGDIRIELETALATDPAMCELATSPLFLPMMAEVHRDLRPARSKGQDDGNGENTTNPDVLRERIFDLYIGRAFAIQTGTNLPRERLADWLVNLAQGMREHSQQIFMTESLQPSWLRSSRDRIRYALLDRFAGGMVAALVVGLVVGASYRLGQGIITDPADGVIAGLANGVRWGLVAGLVVALLGRTVQPTEESSSTRGSTIRRAIFGGLVFVFAGVLFAGLYLPLLDRLPGFAVKAITWQPVLADVLFFAVVGIFGAVILHGPSVRPRVVQVMVSRRWSWSRGLPLGVAVGIAVTIISSYVYGSGGLNDWAIIFGVVYGLSTWIILGLVSVDLEPTAIPNQRIPRTLRYAIAVGLGVGLVSALGSIATGFAVGRPVFGIYYGVSSAALVGLFGGIVSGRFAGISHFALRATLWRSGIFPWNLPLFLDDLARRRLLRREGGGYTFVHPLVAEHIARVWRQRESSGTRDLSQRAQIESG